MRNLKRALSLGLTATMLSGMMVAGAGAASYADVTSANNEKAIDVLKAVGVMTGDDKGNFNPDQKVTRAEMAVIMANMLDLDVDNFGAASIPFTDVPSWAVPYVAACYADGITSGTSATTYGSNDTVTTVQAALMMMKALGYFQYASDFGADWSLATIRQASSIGLFDGIKAGSKDAMTRDEVAQLSLNTLEATMVQANKTGSDINLGNGVIISGGVTYDEVTSGSDYAKAMNNDKKDGNFTVQLGEKLYDGKLKVQEGSSDDFGRPSEKWTYKTTEIGNYAKTADASYTGEVKSKDLYSDLGLGKGVEATVSHNGNSKTDFAIEKGNGNILGGTGNGVITEAFLDDDNNVTIAIIDVKAGTVDQVVPAKDGDAAYIKVNGMKYETEGFEEDDVVYYTQAGGDIKSVAKAGVIEGVTVTKTTDSDFTADGITYKYNMLEKANVQSDVNVDSVLDVYTDGNGFVIDVEVSKASKDYAYILGLKNDGFSDNTSTSAKLLLADGTVTEVELTHSIDGNGNNTFANWENHLVEYTKNSKGKYTLNEGIVPGQNDPAGNPTQDAGTLTNASVEIEKGKSAFEVKNTTYYANSKTIFLVQNGTGNNATYTSYTGYENVPNLKNTSTANIAVYTKTGNVANVVFVSNVSVGSDDIVFVLASDGGVRVSNTTGGTYYEYKAVVNGELQTIKVRHLLAEDGTSDVVFSSISYDDKENEILDGVNSVRYTQNTSEDSFLIDNATVNDDAKNGVMKLNSNYYSISKDVEVFEVFTDKVEHSSVSAVEVDDQADVIIKNGEIVSIFFTDNTTGGGTGPVDTSVDSVSFAGGNVTVTLKNNLPADKTYTVEIQKLTDNGFIKVGTYELTINEGAKSGTLNKSQMPVIGSSGTYKAVVGGKEDSFTV